MLKRIRGLEDDWRGDFSQMILDRFYTPADGELIYHYCRPEAFLEIVRTRTIWATAHYVLNDSMERTWGYSIFAKVAKEQEKEAGKDFIDRIHTMIKMSYVHSVVMISCYSLDADLLSQWRGYADDGRGFAIGFSPKLMEMPAKKLRVLYDEEAQIRELSGNLKHTFEYEKSIGFKFDDQFQTHWFNIGLDLVAYKNPAFSAEKEIRLAHVSGLAPHGKSFKFIPLGARDQEGNRLSSPSPINFRISNGAVVPYVALDYTNQGSNSPIKEVVLGPRNENTETNIELFLSSVGVNDVVVRRSIVPYR